MHEMELTTHSSRFATVAELIALAPGDINDADADGHGRKNQDQDSRTKGVYEAMPALSCLCDAERTALRRRIRWQSEQHNKHGSREQES